MLGNSFFYDVSGRLQTQPDMVRAKPDVIAAITSLNSFYFRIFRSDDFHFGCILIINVIAVLCILRR
jgi:hypothetical protein